MQISPSNSADVNVGKEQEAYDGFIGWFDILGYSQIHENVLVDIAIRVAKSVPEMAKKVQEEQIQKHKEYGGSESWGAQNLTVNVFSDTILAGIPWCEKNPLAPWFTMLLFARDLYQQMFREGLPIRGVIAFGKCYLTRDCFAGKPFIDAHKLAEQLVLSAVVLDDSAKTVARERVKRHMEGWPDEKKRSAFLRLIDDDLIMHFAPLKSDSQGGRPMFLVKPQLCSLVGEAVFKSGDYRQALVNAFTMHGRHLRPGEHAKFENTELFFRCVKEYERRLREKLTGRIKMDHPGSK